MRVIARDIVHIVDPKHQTKRKQQYVEDWHAVPLANLLIASTSFRCISSDVLLTETLRLLQLKQYLLSQVPPVKGKLIAQHL